VSSHVPWARAREERLSRMTTVERAAYQIGYKIARSKLDHETWLVEVEGWLQRALTAARLGNEVEPLAWPVRTLADLDLAAEEEYGSIGWGKQGELAKATWEELKREANVRLLTDFALRSDEAEGVPTWLGYTHAEAQTWGERTYDKLLGELSGECQTCRGSGIDPASGEYHHEVQAIDPASLEPCPECRFPPRECPGPEWGLDAYGRLSSDDHYGHEHE
jgi:hypothetical protein